MHSTDIRMPAGKCNTCGVLLAGAFSGKNSEYTLFRIPKSFPLTIKTVVFTIFDKLLPASSNTVLMFRKHCLAWSSKSSLTIFPVEGSNPGIPDRNMRLSAITACGNTSLMRATFAVLKFFLVLMVKIYRPNTQ
jgi:hypothetical protein